VINATSLASETDETFEITFAAEPWIYEQFWKRWVIFIFALLLVLSYLVSKGYIGRMEASEGPLSKLQSYVTWILELLDMYKDWVLLFAFSHARWAYLGLIGSIVFPFALLNWGNDNTFTHNVLNFFGLTDGSKKDKFNRGGIVFAIALFENIP